MNYKRRNAVARGLLRQYNLGVAMATNHGTMGHFAHLRSGKLIAAKPTLVTIIHEVPHNWSVFMAAICRDDKGTNYMKSEIAFMPEPLKYMDMTDFLNEEHHILLREANPSHLIGAAWVACPWGADIDNEVAANVFTALDAWEDVSAELV